MTVVASPYVRSVPAYVVPPKILVQFRMFRDGEVTPSRKIVRIYRDWDSVQKLDLVFEAEQGELSRVLQLDLATLLAQDVWLVAGLDVSPPKRTRASYMAIASAGVYPFNITSPVDKPEGSGYLAGEFPDGITSRLGVPVSATIKVLYEREDGQMAKVAETTSSPDGTWRIDDLDTNKQFSVLCSLAGFNDLIWTGVSPQPGSTDPWDPSFLTVPAKFWLDGDSDIAESSGAVSQWNDRSGNGIHFSQGSAGSRPLILPDDLNGHRTVRFDGSNDSLLNTSTEGRSIFSSTGYGWLFSVYRRRSSGTGACCLLQSRTGSGSGRFAAYTHSDGAGNKPALVLRRLDSNSAVVQWSPTIVGEEWVMVLHAAKWADGQSEIHVNGGDPVTVAGTSSGLTSSALSGTAVYLGSEGVTTFADVDLACSIAGAGEMPSEGDIDKLFGWAAWKFGLYAKLPSDHLYRYQQPYQ